jgi:hypothetical protein
MSILIAQLNLESNHIQYNNNNNNNIILIKNKTLLHGRTRQMTRSVNNRQTETRSVYTNRCVPRAYGSPYITASVWLYKTISD